MNHLYSDVVKAKDLAPSCASDVSPDSRNFSLEYPDGQRSSEAIVAGTLAAIHDSDTPTMKGLPDTLGSVLTSVYSTPVPEEGETNGDAHKGWTTVTRKSCRGSPVRESHQGTLAPRSHRESPARKGKNKTQLRPEQEHTMQEAIKQLTKEQQQKIYERQHVISIAGVKKPRTKSTSSRGEGPSKSKGKGPDPCNWGALSAYENELDLEAQREALASWKVTQELARSEQENKPDLSAKGEESNVEAQREAIASWNKAHELAKQEPESRDCSLWAPSSRSSSASEPPSKEGTLRVPTLKSNNRPVKVLSPKVDKTVKDRGREHRKSYKEKGKPVKRTPDLVRVMIEKTMAQDNSRFRRHKTPRAMEPVEQVNPKSYIGMAFEQLGGKDRQTHQCSSDDSSSGRSSSPSDRKRRRKRKNR